MGKADARNHGSLAMTINRDEALEAFAMFEPETYCMTNEEIKRRTLKQNSALWKYLTLLAEEMDGAGLDMREAISVPIQPTKDNVKSEMWDRVQMALFPEIDSSRKLSTRQIQQVYENMNRFTAQKFGISVEWPSEEPPMVSE